MCHHTSATLEQQRCCPDPDKWHRGGAGRGGAYNHRHPQPSKCRRGPHRTRCSNRLRRKFTLNRALGSSACRRRGQVEQLRGILRVDPHPSSPIRSMPDPSRCGIHQNLLAPLPALAEELSQLQPEVIQHRRALVAGRFSARSSSWFITIGHWRLRNARACRFHLGADVLNHAIMVAGLVRVTRATQNHLSILLEDLDPALDLGGVLTGILADAELVADHSGTRCRRVAAPWRSRRCRRGGPGPRPSETVS